MSNVHLWKLPKENIPTYREAYRNQEWLYLVKAWNEYLVGEQLCLVCPASVERVRSAMKPIFLADIEVLYKEGKRATDVELAELFIKYVSPDAELSFVQRLHPRFLAPAVALFANADLYQRLVPQRRRQRILHTVLRVSLETFYGKFTDRHMVG